MVDRHDPDALIRHAASHGDWRLVELVARVLSGRARVGRPGARRAYLTLVEQLGLLNRSQ
jgi:hypothetical protein